MDIQEKRKFELIEHIAITYRATKGFLYNKLYKKQNGMNFKFKERIMLAVTEVNGCIMCSYVHTKLSLKAGLSNKDIKDILSGDLEGVPEDEALAVLFAKDYAFNHEKIDPLFYDKLEKSYGIRKARAILGAIEFITMTNSIGVSLALLKNTLGFKHVKGSNILNELLIPLLTFVVFPLFLLINILVIPFHNHKINKKVNKA